MKKVLVFCSDVVPVGGVATSGGGLRSWQIVQGLKGRGFDVVYTMPMTSYLRRKYSDNLLPDGQHSLWTASNQREIIRREKPDVVVLTKPGLKFWSDDIDIPLALDFHGPDLIEFEQMVKGQWPEGRALRATAKLRAIAASDFCTCAGRRQRYYFMGFLMMAGVGLADLDLHYMPVAMSPHLPEHRPDLSGLSLIFSGGFYPWLNPMPGLLDLTDLLSEMQIGHLDIFGGSHETNPEEKRQFEDFQATLSKNPRVTFHGYVSREELVQQYGMAHAAFELMPSNPERELAFTTRTVEFLWAGLPVIYNDYAELSEMIAEYGAGWLVPPGDRKALAEVIRKIKDNPDEVKSASENAQRLVRERLTYDRVIDPLAKFCENPKLRKRSLNFDFRFVPSSNGRSSLVDVVYSNYKQLSLRDFVAKVAGYPIRVAKRKLGMHLRSG